MFREETPSLLEDLHSSVHEQDIQRTRAMAHRLKGSCVYVGLEEATALAEKLEHLDSSEMPHVIGLLERLDHALKEVLAVP